MPSSLSPVGEAQALEISEFDFDPTCRCGTAPLTLNMTAKFNGRPPFEMDIDWGDGTLEEIGTSIYVVSESHVYTAGNYTLTVTLTDDSDIELSWDFAVSAWVSGYTGTVDYEIFVEVNPTPASFTRQVNRLRGLMVYVTNTGSAPMTGSIQTRWWTDEPGYDAMVSGFTSTYTVSIGETRPLRSNHYESVTVGTHNDWVYVNHTGSGLSERVDFDVIVSTSSQEPSITASISPLSRSIAVGATTTYTITILNTGSFSIIIPHVYSGPSWISVVPTDPGGATHTVNDDYVWYTSSPSDIILAGETLTVNISAQPVSAGSGTLTWTLTPVSMASDTTGTPVATGDSVRLEAFLTTTLSGALVDTVDVTVISQTSAEFIGAVTYLHANEAYIDVWFQYRVSGSTTWSFVEPTQERLYGLGSFTVTVTGLTGNTTYEVFAVGQTNSGVLAYGDEIEFITLTPGDVQPFRNILQIIGDITGFDSAIIGLFFGLIPIIIVILVFAYFGIPAWVYGAIIILLMIVNTLLFLWPSWTLVPVFVFVGLQMWAKFREGGEE